MNFLKYSDEMKRDIKYQCFNYKDCQSKKKEFEIEREENEPKLNLRLAYIDIKIFNRNLEISTPPMLCLFGFNRNNGEICLQLQIYRATRLARLGQLEPAIQALEQLRAEMPFNETVDKLLGSIKAKSAAVRQRAAAEY